MIRHPIEIYYDIELTSAVASNVSIPVIASGGAGNMEHFYDAFTKGNADAALAASLFHYTEMEIKDLKKYLSDTGIPMRLEYIVLQHKRDNHYII